MAAIVLTSLTWYILITASLVSLSLVIFLVLLVRQYILKKTIGILLLTIFYFGFTVAEILNTIGLWYYSFVSTTNNISANLELNFPLFYSLSYIFLYFFLNRHILQDNDLIKALTSILLSVFIGLVSAFMFGEVLYNIPEPIFYHQLPMIGTNIVQFLPSFLSGVLIFMPIFIFIHIRIIVQLYFIRKRVDEELEKKGITFIMFSLISLILSALSASLFTLPGIQLYPWLIYFFHTIRILFFVGGLILGYFGWIFPDWLRKRVLKT